CGRRKYSESRSRKDVDFTDIPPERIRNFSIIAHVDHGKSTLADRLLEYTGAIKKGHHQILDKLQVERERGITVKAQSASLLFNFKGEDYLLNLIDTPGHVDFSNEISAKLGTGVEAVLEAIVTKIPSPPVDRNAKFRALLFDSSYDRYRGVLSLIYVKDGCVCIGDSISTYHMKKDYEVKSLALLRPDEVSVNKLVAGQIGLVGCNMRSSKEAYIGDTLYHSGANVEALQGFNPSQPMVVMLQYELPLCEIILDFHDTLKTLSAGNLVKLNILLNGNVVEELSCIVHVTKAVSIGKQMVAKLKDIIPRQMVQIAIQATVRGKIVARETLKAYRKDVTAKLYGGDVTRRMKLLAQQAAGKKKMRMVANISIPRDTFIDVLKK
ncbi:hypothetical protein NQ315_016991, partial [Exocentrus adspersus]